MDNTKVNLLEQAQGLILRYTALRGEVVDLTELTKYHTAPPNSYYTLIYFNPTFYYNGRTHKSDHLMVQEVKLDMVTRHPSELPSPPIPYPHSYKFHFSKVYPPQSCPELSGDQDRFLGFYNRHYGKRWVLIKRK